MYMYMYMYILCIIINIMAIVTFYYNKYLFINFICL